MANLKWVADPAHTEIQFRVKHLMITTVTGHFKQFDIIIETESQDPTRMKSILFTADTDSIDTHNAQRDTHLKSPEFFDSAKFPQLKFVGKDLKKKKDHYELTGDLTIRGVTKKVMLDVEFSGVITDPWEQLRAGFTVHGKINRKDFGLRWSSVTEAGNVVVSDEVTLQGEIQLILQGTETPLPKENVVQEAEVS
jgi:polyisoprenoid-binding protein YceI